MNLHPTNEPRLVEAIKRVEALFPEMAIALVVMPRGSHPGRRANYIGNSERAEVFAMLKEIIARWEGRVHEPPETKQ